MKIALHFIFSVINIAPILHQTWMTSLMLTQRDNKYILLYSCLNEISSVFTITEKLTRISLSNGTYVLSPWLHRQWRHSVTANFGKSAISDRIFISIHSFIHSLFVCLCVCLFVCLSGWKITHNSPTLSYIIIKFHPQMHLGLVQNLLFLEVKGQITRSPGQKLCQIFKWL